MNAAAVKIDPADLSTNHIVEEYCSAIIADIGDTKFAEKRLAKIAGCGGRTARNWLDKLNAPDDIYKIRLIRSGHFPTVAAVYLKLAGIQPGIDPRLAHALNAAFAVYQQSTTPALPQGGHMTDPSRITEPDGWDGENDA